MSKIISKSLEKSKIVGNVLPSPWRRYDRRIYIRYGRICKTNIYMHNLSLFSTHYKKIQIIHANKYIPKILTQIIYKICMYEKVPITVLN